MEKPDDKSYADATPRAMGRLFGELWQGLVESGVPTEQATDIVCSYALGLAKRGSN